MSRRASHSPLHNNKENDPPQDNSTPSSASKTTIGFSYSPGSILSKDERISKKKSRQSLSRRVSFNSKVDVRHFYKSTIKSPPDTPILPAATENESEHNLHSVASQVSAVPVTPSRNSLDMDVDLSLVSFPTSKYRESLSPKAGKTLGALLSELQPPVASDQESCTTTTFMRESLSPKAGKSLNALLSELQPPVASDQESYTTTTLPTFMKTPSIEKVLANTEPEDTLTTPMATMPEEDNYTTTTLPTFMKTPSIEKLLANTEPEDTLTTSMTTLPTFMQTPSIRQLVKTEPNEDTVQLTQQVEDHDEVPSNTTTFSTFMHTPSIGKLLSKTHPPEEDELSQVLSQVAQEQHILNFEIPANLRVDATPTGHQRTPSLILTPNIKKVISQARDSITGSLHNTPNLTSRMSRVSINDMDTGSLRTPLKSLSTLSTDVKFNTPSSASKFPSSPVHRYSQQQQQDIIQKAIGQNQNTVDLLNLIKMDIKSPEFKEAMKRREEAQTMSVNNFFFLAELRFLDDASIDRRPSVAVRPSLMPPAATDMQSLLAIGAYKLPEHEITAWRCDQLKTVIVEINQTVHQLEQSLTENNPLVFSEIKSERAAELKEELKKLKNHCRQEAKDHWCAWELSVAEKYNQTITENCQALRADVTKLHQYSNQISVLRDCRPSMQEDVLLILSRLSAWQLQSLSEHEIVLRFENLFLLRFSMDLDTGKVTSKSFILATTDEFIIGLLESAALPTLIQSLDVVSQLSNILQEISARAGRVRDLHRELHKLQRSFTIRMAKANNNQGGTLDIEFSCMQRMSKFFVSFTVPYHYPFGKLDWSFSSLFGDVSEHEVAQVIHSIPNSFGKLTKLCTKLRNL